MERRLAAIVAADMVGFSSQMQADEVGTLERLKLVHAELIEAEQAVSYAKSLIEAGLP